MNTIIAPTSTGPTMFDGTPVASAFPKWATDESTRHILVHHCASHLVAWRRAVASHKRLVTCERKLAARVGLEVAWGELREAWRAVVACGVVPGVD